MSTNIFETIDKFRDGTRSGWILRVELDGGSGGGVKQRTVVWRLSLLDAGTNAMGLLMSMG